MRNYAQNIRLGLRKRNASKRSVISRGKSLLLFLIMLCFSVSNSFSFDVGVPLASSKEIQLHTELIIQEEKRKIEVSASNNNEILQKNGIDPLSHATQINNISLRATLNIKSRILVYLEGGLHNDLKKTGRSPSFLGAGVKFELIKISKMKIVPFASVHRTNSYTYEFDIESSDQGFKAYFNSNLNFYSRGVLLVYSLSLPGNNVITSYFGWEESFIISDHISSFKIGTINATTKYSDDISVKSIKNKLFVFGVNLLRREYMTVRFETQFWTSRENTSLNFGFLF